MPDYGVADYQPALPDEYRASADGAGVPYDAGTFSRPRFDPAVRGALERITERMEGTDADGGRALYYRCGSCGRLGEGSSMHMGHKLNWAAYVKSKQPQNLDAAERAYNDLNNLHFEHGVCNTSHLFENGAVSDSDEAEGIFEALRDRYASGSSGGILRIGSVDVLLAEPIVGHRSDTAYDGTMGRPAWDKSTRGGLIAIWAGNGWIRDGADPEGQQVTFYRCASCGNWGEGFSMQLGHILPWKGYLADIRQKAERDGYQMTVADAVWAYNDLNNLQFEHPVCNQGHEWEEYDPADPEFARRGSALEAALRAYEAARAERNTRVAEGADRESGAWQPELLRALVRDMQQTLVAAWPATATAPVAGSMGDPFATSEQRQNHARTEVYAQLLLDKTQPADSYTDEQRDEAAHHVLHNALDWSEDERNLVERTVADFEADYRGRELEVVSALQATWGDRLPAAISVEQLDSLRNALTGASDGRVQVGGVDVSDTVAGEVERFRLAFRNSS